MKCLDKEILEMGGRKLLKTSQAYEFYPDKLDLRLHFFKDGRQTPHWSIYNC